MSSLDDAPEAAFASRSVGEVIAITIAAFTGTVVHVVAVRQPSFAEAAARFAQVPFRVVVEYPSAPAAPTGAAHVGFVFDGHCS